MVFEENEASTDETNSESERLQKVNDFEEVEIVVKKPQKSMIEYVVGFGLIAAGGLILYKKWTKTS